MKPILDPELPASDRALMAAHPQFLNTPIAAPRWGGRVPADAWASLLSASLWGFLPALIAPLYGRLALVGGLILQAGLLTLWIGYGFTTMFLTGLGLELIVFLLLLALAGESPVSRLARRHRGRFRLAGDFEPEDAALMERTQTAVATVLESKVNEAGLLDDIANRVTLPRQEWEIAETLTEMTRLRREQRSVRRGKVTDRISTMLATHADALRVATESLTQRVDALEDYALRTMAADEAYTEWQTLQDMAEDSDAYRELLARTVRDRLAAGELDAMSERARLVEAALRESVKDARRAGLVLLPEAS
ncbi:hypothetical protein Aph01nite_37830 [Acrocarpospora phusangensis]|uniref:Uncharacterized protein n=1 Tax=Acrocarpospora phusangensis TaxID=1070424 RepID=A0A919UPK6_9ACTN|nr:hypothetical protein [Acrocarpospora phusangensis]GIH25473.1 hypothetical protein Aph01nite_37830 [Acrocarpospora phusangensis]